MDGGNVGDKQPNEKEDKESDEFPLKQRPALSEFAMSADKESDEFPLEPRPALSEAAQSSAAAESDGVAAAALEICEADGVRSGGGVEMPSKIPVPEEAIPEEAMGTGSLSTRQEAPWWSLEPASKRAGLPLLLTDVPTGEEGSEVTEALDAWCAAILKPAVGGHGAHPGESEHPSELMAA